MPVFWENTFLKVDHMLCVVNLVVTYSLLMLTNIHMGSPEGGSPGTERQSEDREGGTWT